MCLLNEFSLDDHKDMYKWRRYQTYIKMGLEFRDCNIEVIDRLEPRNPSKVKVKEWI